MAFRLRPTAKRHRTISIVRPNGSVTKVAHTLRNAEPLTKLRIFIVDDEPLARARVRSFLANNPAVEISGEYGDGEEALESIRAQSPDIVFLDVQMPGCNSFQLLAALPPAHRPAIVIATAHERFAVDAFTEDAVDYLLKPFSRERFQVALMRAVGHIRSRRGVDLGTRIETMLARTPAPEAERISIKVDGRLLFIKPADIIWVEAANNYATLHLASNKRLLVRETLLSLEKRLGPRQFARVNRSALVHMDQVVEMHPSKYGDYLVLLRNGTSVPLSRNLRSRFEALLTDRR
jgi:two-component system LytT family response regulator